MSVCLYGVLCGCMEILIGGDLSIVCLGKTLCETFRQVSVDSSTYFWRLFLQYFLGSIVVSISACHVEDPGSNLSREAPFFHFLISKAYICSIAFCFYHTSDFFPLQADGDGLV